MALHIATLKKIAVRFRLGSLAGAKLRPRDCPRQREARPYSQHLLQCIVIVEDAGQLVLELVVDPLRHVCHAELLVQEHGSIQNNAQQPGRQPVGVNGIVRHLVVVPDKLLVFINDGLLCRRGGWPLLIKDKRQSINCIGLDVQDSIADMQMRIVDMATSATPLLDDFSRKACF